MPKPSCGAHHKALACSLQIKSGREEWMGAEEQKALTAAMGGAQGELPKEHPDLSKPTPGPCPCAKPVAPLAKRVSSCRRSCLSHSRTWPSPQHLLKKRVFTLLLWPKSSPINCNPGTLASSTPQVARTLLPAFSSSYHAPPCPPQRVEVASPCVTSPAPQTEQRKQQ